MRVDAKTVSVIMLLIMLVLNVSSCSKLLGPSDDDALKAINDSGWFNRYTLKSPIVIVKIGDRDKEGFWHVEVKYTFIFTMGNGQPSPPTENTSFFRIRKATDSAGHVTWRAQVSAD